MLKSVAVSWAPSWSTDVFALSYPPSSLQTQHPVSLSSSTKTWWPPCTQTVQMSSSCCSPRLVQKQTQHVEEIIYMQSGTVIEAIFHLPLQFDLCHWLNDAQPVFSERTRLLELIHGVLCVCGREPEPELLTPFHLFTKHWTWLLRYHFPDHYSDCLRLLMTSKCVSVCNVIQGNTYSVLFF